MSLTKLREKSQKLEKERVNINQKKLYQERKATETNNPNKFSKFDTMARFYIQQLQKIDQEISEVNLAIVAEEDKDKDKAHRKLIKDFCQEARELILTFKQTLEAEEFLEAIKGADDLREYFEERGSVIEEYVYPILHYVKFTSIKITLSKILEEIGEKERIMITHGPKIAVQKDVNIQRWKDMLIGQMNSLLQIIEDILDDPTKGVKVKPHVQETNKGAVTGANYKTDRQYLVEQRIKEAKGVFHQLNTGNEEDLRKRLIEKLRRKGKLTYE